MATTSLASFINAAYSISKPKNSVLTRFFTWCENQNDNRLLWLGIALAGHGCILTPFTLLAIVFAGSSFTLFMLAIVAMQMVLVTNLAAMPTKTTIPVFFLSVLIDIVLSIMAISQGMHLSNVF